MIVLRGPMPQRLTIFAAMGLSRIGIVFYGLIYGSIKKRQDLFLFSLSS